MRRLLLLLCLMVPAWAVVAPPVMQVPSTARATVGVWFAGLLDATNSPTSFSAASLPPGLSLDASGLISGTPTTAGTYTVTVGAANAGGPAGPATIIITVDTAGTGSVSNADMFRVSSGNACSLQLVSALDPPVFTATGLPGGMSISDGLISGIPFTTGVSWVEVSADGDTTATVLSIDVRTPSVAAPIFDLLVQPQAAVGVTGAPFACMLTANAAGPVVYNCSNLPAWLNLSSGLLSGTPTFSDTTINLKLSASSGAAAADTVMAIPLAHFGVGVAIPASPAFLDATVGSGLGWVATASVTGAVFSNLDALPAGLDLQGDVLVGTPTVAGNANVRLSATLDVLGVPTVVTTTLAFRIADLTVGAPQIEAVVPPVLTASVPCALSVRTSVGTATTFALSGPAGWTIDNTGLVTATPSAAGIVSLRVTASNAAHQSSVTTILAQVNAADSDAPLPTTPVVLLATVDSPCTAVLRSSPTAVTWTALGLPADLPLTSHLGLVSGVPITAEDCNLQLTATGAGGNNSTSAVLRVAAKVTGAPVFTDAGPWYLTQGQGTYIALAATGATAWSVNGLPAGLVLDPATGVISGTPTATGSADLSVTASAGSKHATTTIAVFITALPAGAPVFTSPSLLLGTVGSPFAASVTATGTTLGYTASPLPAGLGLDAGTGAISGTPTTAGNTTVQVTAQNGSGTTSTVLIIRIAGPAGTVDPAVSGVSGGGCGAGAAGLLLLGGLALRRRRR